MSFFLRGPTAKSNTSKALQGLKAFSLLLMLVGAPTSAWAEKAPQVWFFMTNYGDGSQTDGRQGWERLFGRPRHDWPDVMRSVKVVAAGKVEQVPNDVLKQVFLRLNEHHVAFAVEILAQNWVGEAPCGQGVESYSDPASAAKIAAKIKAAGGRIDYVMMDEPLFYGHYYGGINACRSPVDSVARRAARLVAEYTAVFPNVIVGDNEPVPAVVSAGDWQSVYASWLSAFKTASSRPISVTHLDVDWDKPSWKVGVKAALSFLAQSHVRTGIIYDAAATGTATSNSWFNSADRNMTALHSSGIAADDVIFQSWTRFPGKSFSDSRGLGEDDLLRRYLKIEKGEQ